MPQCCVPNVLTKLFLHCNGWGFRLPSLEDSFQISDVSLAVVTEFDTNHKIRVSSLGQYVDFAKKVEPNFNTINKLHQITETDIIVLILFCPRLSKMWGSYSLE